jgi:hypothetical protein
VSNEDAYRHAAAFVLNLIARLPRRLFSIIRKYNSLIPLSGAAGKASEFNQFSSLQIEDSPQSGTKLFDLFTIEGPRLVLNNSINIID